MAVAVTAEQVLADVRADLESAAAMVAEAGHRGMLPGLHRLVAIAAEPTADPAAVLTRLGGLYADLLAARDGFGSAYVPDRPGGCGVDRERTAELTRLRNEIRELLRPYREFP